MNKDTNKRPKLGNPPNPESYYSSKKVAQAAQSETAELRRQLADTMKALEKADSETRIAVHQRNTSYLEIAEWRTHLVKSQSRETALSAEVERLREALGHIQDCDRKPDLDAKRHYQEIARKALSQPTATTTGAKFLRLAQAAKLWNEYPTNSALQANLSYAVHTLTPEEMKLLEEINP